MPPAAARLYAQEALLSMLLPLWQLVIGACVLVTVVVSTRRLARRGRSRMTTALLVSGVLILGLTTLGLLLSAH